MTEWTPDEQDAFNAMTEYDEDSHDEQIEPIGNDYLPRPDPPEMQYLQDRGGWGGQEIIDEAWNATLLENFRPGVVGFGPPDDMQSGSGGGEPHVLDEPTKHIKIGDSIMDDIKQTGKANGVLNLINMSPGMVTLLEKLQVSTSHLPIKTNQDIIHLALIALDLALDKNQEEMWVEWLRDRAIKLYRARIEQDTQL